MADDALLRQGYDAAGQPTARRRAASLPMTYSFLQKFLGWGILPRKWRLTCCSVFRQSALNAGKNRLQVGVLILTSGSLPPLSPPAVAQLFFVRSMRLHHPK